LLAVAAVTARIALRSLKHVGEQAAANAEARHAQAVRQTAAELIKASGDLALRPSEVLGGLIGGAGAAATGFLLISVASISAIAMPFIGAAGIRIGVLSMRGLVSIKAERERRTRAVVAEAALDRPRLLRGEIAAASLEMVLPKQSSNGSGSNTFRN